MIENIKCLIIHKYTIENIVYVQNIRAYIFRSIHLLLKAEIWDCILDESSDRLIF